MVNPIVGGCGFWIQSVSWKLHKKGKVRQHCAFLCHKSCFKSCALSIKTKCFSLKSACRHYVSKHLKENSAVVVKKKFQLRKDFNFFTIIYKALVWKQYCMHCCVFLSDESLSRWPNHDVIIMNHSGGS